MTTPTPHHSIFTGRMPFLSPKQQRQSTEGGKTGRKTDNKCIGFRAERTKRTLTAFTPGAAPGESLGH